ncbi:MAG: dUTPase [Verrucomicrobia bacterium]|nr:dUTPase [Verrucomicrobiota bacterium]MCH8511515.1 dUTPase [Kiritimatiellia bacterium]
MNKTDMLQDLFDKQMSLNHRIGVNPGEMDEAERIQWVLNYTRATSQELAELVDSVPWKWWAKYQKFDLQNARVEVVDLFHFLISLAQVLGMDAKDVHDLYNQKNKVNFQRQDSGYATKDEDDNKDLGV